MPMMRVTGVLKLSLPLLFLIEFLVPLSLRNREGCLILCHRGEDLHYCNS